MQEESHGFYSREEWTQFFTDYNTEIWKLNDTSYKLVQSDLSAEDWIEEYMKNSAAIREAYRKNEEMLDRHIRCFTRGKERWTRQIADPLISFMFRYITRIQDLGTACELAQSLLEFYEGLGDDVAVMKCLLARAFCCDFLDGIHLEDQVKEDCARASIIYEREFLRLTPEEQSMGLSIYDLEFDRLSNRLKLGDISPALIEEMVEIHSVSQKALDYVVAVDQGYEFNLLLPDFDYYLGFCALCLSPGECTQEQCAAILAAARRRQETSEKETGHSECYRVRTGLVYHMAMRLSGLISDKEVMDGLHELMDQSFISVLFTEGGTFSQHSLEAMEGIELAVENITHRGKTDEELFDRTLRLFTEYFFDRAYTTFVDYVCGTCSYCYIQTALPHARDKEMLLNSLLKLTMFRQVQTAIHSYMVGYLAVDILESMIEHKPELLIGQLRTHSVEEVRKRKEDFLLFLYQGALLHDIGKLLCSSVINAQSHRLGDLEFQVLRFHPQTGGEMLQNLPQLSIFRDIALGHQKSFDGKSGYPADFDNTGSPIKIFIDIITICDSLDAATDHLGRNYTQAKDFDTVMKELRAGRDTRYSGAVTDLLDEDIPLQKKVRKLLGDGRRDVYFNVHKKILEETRHPELKSTHDWMFNLYVASPDK